MRSSGYWVGATLAFAAELGSLAGLALWGVTVPSGWVARVLLGAGLPLAAALLWGAFAAPRARFHATAPAVAVKVAVQGGAVAALVAAGHPWLGAVLAVAAALGAVLTARPTPAAATPTRTGPEPPAGGPPTG
jgi:Protein of unknown function (DUF2568)